MSPMRFLMALVAAFVFVFAFDFVFHGVYMKDAWYDPHSSFWRPPEEALMQWMMIGQFLMVFAIAMTLVFSGKHGAGAGATAGLCVAIAYASLYIVFYAVQPFPSGMVINWILGAGAEAIMAGALFGGIYRTR